MKFIKKYYDEHDYKDLLNYYMKKFIENNFLDIKNYEYEYIFKNSINKIVNDILENKIKSDKKLFEVLRSEFNYLSFNNSILNNELKRYDLLFNKFKSDEFKTIDNRINYNFFVLKIKGVEY